MKSLKLFQIIMLLSFVLSACQVATPVPASPTALPPTKPAATETLKPSNTPAPTATPVPPTATATATLVPSATPTATLTPTPVFAGFRVLYTEYQRFGLMFAFSIPGIKQAYDLRVNKVKYSCSLYPKLPDQMFCMGPEFPHNRKVDLAFYAPNAAANAEPIYKIDHLIAPIKTPTPEWYIPKGTADCPVRGIGVTCETEDRPVTWPGGPCIVSTCVDICGYWYSIDTCGK